MEPAEQPCLKLLIGAQAGHIDVSCGIANRSKWYSAGNPGNHSAIVPPVEVAISQSRFFSGTRVPSSRERQPINVTNLMLAGQINDALACANQISEVCPIVPRPSMQLQPSHQADDMGAKLGVPFSFSVLISATGEPKYKIVGR